MTRECGKIGQLVSADSFYRYTVRVCKVGEEEHTPAPADYRPGRFVKILVGGQERTSREELSIVGIIADVMIVNPEYNELMAGMKKEHVQTFSPDLFDEQATFLSVVGVGSLGAGGGQSPVNLVPEFHADVVLMNQDEIQAFHYVTSGGGGRQGFQLSYLPYLRDMAGFHRAGLLHSFLGELGALFPEESEKISIIQKNMDWELRMRK